VYAAASYVSAILFRRQNVTLIVCISAVALELRLMHNVLIPNDLINTQCTIGLTHRSYTVKNNSWSNYYFVVKTIETEL